MAISKRCSARAGEIKQDKRRQTLIDNAELARISKRLVTLDQNVDLDVPVEDLAVHEPDYKQADRVPEGDGILHADAARRRKQPTSMSAQIEADARLVSGAKPLHPAPSGSSPPPLRQVDRRRRPAGG